MSDERKAWAELLEICEALGLPTPVLSPSRLGNQDMIEIGEFLSFGDRLQCIEKCRNFCTGYRYRRIQEEKTQETIDRKIPTDKWSANHFAWGCAQEVIDGKGHLGPQDHVLLAKAIKALVQ